MSLKKDLLNEYKQRKFCIGVFQVRNTANGKLFIGSAMNVDAVWNRIRAELRMGGHRNEGLQRDWNELGEEQFAFELLSEIQQKDDSTTDHSREVKELEKMFLDELKPWGERGYHNVPRA